MAEQTQPCRILVVGCGKMGEALVEGWLASDSGEAAGLGPCDIAVVNPGRERCEEVRKRHGVRCVEDAAEAPEADIVVLAVKPQVMAEAIGQLDRAGAFASHGGRPVPLVVSIAAGTSTGALEALLPEGARVVRVMPNTPLMVGQGASAVAAGARVAEADVELVCGLFGCLGEAVIVPEGSIDAVCALSGGGPAYVAAMVEALRDAGAAQGLDAALAERLVLQTLKGTCALMEEKGQTPEQTRVAVCSPGGTTLAALAAMEQAGFSSALAQGVEAAVQRAKELDR